MALKDMNWKLVLAYGGALLLILLLFILLPPQVSAPLFLLAVILSIGLGLWMRSREVFSLRVPGIAAAIWSRPAAPPSESRSIPAPAPQVSEAPADDLPLRRVSRVEFFGLYIDVNVPSQLDPTLQSLERIWNRLSPRLSFAPFVVTIIIFALLTRSIILGMLFQTQDHFIYTLDDPYIAMAIAKNLALHGVWGITQYGFSSTSSSPLWTLLISSIFRVVGPLELVPLIVNLVCAVLVFAFLAYSLQRRGVARIYVFFTLMALMLITPFLAAMMTGMEHVLHMLLFVAFLHFMLDVFALPSISPGHIGITALFAGLVVSARYESLLLVIPACGLLVLRGRLRPALIIGAAAALPPVLYGLYSTAHGWEFLPNSLILKASHVEIDTFSKLVDVVHETVRGLLQRPELLLLFVVPVVVLLVRLNSRKRFWTDRASVGLMLVALAVFFHRALIPTIPFIRYDAYLFAIGFYVLALALCDLPPDTVFKFRFERLPTYAALAMLLVVCGFAGYIISTERDSTQIWGGSGNIYSQQYQMGRFVHQYYNDATVALNDIGAVSYLSNARVVDLWGLGTNEVALAKINGTFTPEFIDTFTQQQHVKIAIIYESWFNNMLPEHWVKVAAWFTGNSGILGGEWVTFFALDPKDAPELAAHMQEFIPTLGSGTAPQMLYEPPPA